MSTANTVVDGWGKYQALKGFSRRTIERRQWSLSKLEQFVGTDHLTTCTGEQLEEWLAGYGNVQTRYTLRSDVNQFFIYAIRRGHASHNPAVDVDPPRLAHRLPTPVPMSEIRYLIANTDGPIRTMIMLSSHAGLRVSETAALRYSDLLDGTIHVRSGKGGKDRSVPIGTELAASLPAGHGQLFPGLDGQAVSERIRQQFRKLDIAHRPHDLRHSFGTDLARRRVPIEIIAQLMGHSSLATTKGYILLAAPERRLVEGMYDDQPATAA